MAVGIHPVAGTTWLFPGGSVKLGSVTVTSWFISMHVVLAPLMIMGSLSLTCDLNLAGLYGLDGRLLLMGDRDDVGVSTYTSVCLSSKFSDRPKKSHFTCPLFAPAMGLCPLKAYGE